MGLIERLKHVIKGVRSANPSAPPSDLKSSSTQPEKKLESLLVMVVPKKIFANLDYKDSRGLVTSFNSSYFDSCALDLHHAILEGYGSLFDMSKKDLSGGVCYEFKKGDTEISYFLRAVGSFINLTERWSNDVEGTIFITQPAINLDRASTFLKTALEHNLLDYRSGMPARFGLCYKGTEGSTIMEGDQLLERLDVHPTEVAEYISVMYFGKYCRKSIGGSGGSPEPTSESGGPSAATTSPS